MKEVEFIFGTRMDSKETKKELEEYLSNGWVILTSGGTQSSFWILISRDKVK